MSPWQSTPGLAGRWGQDEEVASNPTEPELEGQYRRALRAMARWDGTLALDAHPLLQRQRDRVNITTMRQHPDLAVGILHAIPVRLADPDAKLAWRDCCRWTPRVLLGLDAQRWPPMGWSAIFIRELVAGFVRPGGADWRG
ncbi:MAG: hypothetical protein KIT54_02440 [Phycisphaeraceae bacterium]|nr:hypothetical protein [Phycisphaeraceae bacterium]